MWETVRPSHSEDNTCWPVTSQCNSSTRPHWVQHAFSAQCDCQHSFPGLTRGAAHNRRRRHRAVVIRNGWMGFYGRHHSERFCARLMHYDLWEHQRSGPPCVSSLTRTAARGEKCCVKHVCEMVLNFIYVTINFNQFMLQFIQFKLFPNFSPKYLKYFRFYRINNDKIHPSLVYNQELVCLQLRWSHASVEVLSLQPSSCFKHDFSRFIFLVWNKHGQILCSALITWH